MSLRTFGAKEQPRWRTVGKAVDRGCEVSPWPRRFAARGLSFWAWLMRGRIILCLRCRIGDRVEDSAPTRYQPERSVADYVLLFWTFY
jgi:hypothetical protein